MLAINKNFGFLFKIYTIILQISLNSTKIILRSKKEESKAQSWVKLINLEQTNLVLKIVYKLIKQICKLL